MFIVKILHDTDIFCPPRRLRVTCTSDTLCMMRGPSLQSGRVHIDLAPLLVHDLTFLSRIDALKIIVIIAEVISPNKEEVWCIIQKMQENITEG